MPIASWVTLLRYIHQNPIKGGLVRSGPQQKHYLYEVHEQGVGPRTLSRLTGVPYAIVQRATSGSSTTMSMAGVCEPSPCDAEYETYLDEDDFAEYPEY